MSATPPIVAHGSASVPSDLGGDAPSPRPGDRPNVLERLARGAAAACVVAIAVLALTEIVLRPLNVHFFWASETSGLLMAWTVFLALPAATRARSHLSIDFLVKASPPGVRRALRAFGAILMLVYVAVLTYYCARMAWSSYASDLRSSTIMRIPVVYAQGGVVAGLALLFVTQTLMLASDIAAALGGRDTPDEAGTRR